MNAGRRAELKKIALTGMEILLPTTVMKDMGNVILVLNTNIMQTDR